MKKIKKAFENKANIGFIVAGYPSIEHTENFLKNLDESKIDILEIAIPYSDAIADGEVIENASLEAIKNKVNTNTVFDLLEKTKKDVSKPLVFLIYYNLIFAYGIDKFIKRAKECGISGFIVPDLPYEESKSLRDKLEKKGIALIGLVSLASSNRIKKLVKASKGFIYAVCVLGITGGEKAEEKDLKNLILEIKKFTKTPIALGFGIKTKEDIKKAKELANGAIVGTKIVEICKKYPDNTMEKINELFS